MATTHFVAQDLLLKHLHEHAIFDHFVFKGGTALSNSMRQRRTLLHRSGLLGP